MKIKLTIEIDVGSEFDGWNRWEIGQVLSEEYIHTVVCAHGEAALNWMVKKEGQEQELADLIIAEHNKWAVIAKTAKWDFEIL